MQALLLVYIVMSWFVPPYNRFRMFVDDIVNRFLDPIRRIMPNTGMIDFSPFILMLLLQFLDSAVKSVF
jgi:YggT family protein